MRSQKENVQELQVTQEVQKRSRFATYAAAVMSAFGLAAVSAPAYALDTTEVVNTIKGASTAVDAVGLAIIGVVTGMVVIGLIVGMLMRKGR